MCSSLNAGEIQDPEEVPADGWLFKKEHDMFESTGEMIVFLVVFVAICFPFVYLPLKGRKARQTPVPPRVSLQDRTNPEVTSGGKGESD